MGGGEGVKGNLKNEEAEQVVGSSLEPDPRYMRCCSSVCRPGYALRDALLGLLVLLGLAVVVTVIFVVCFYVVPEENQPLLAEDIYASNAEGVIRGQVDVNEVTLQDKDRYTVAPGDDPHGLSHGDTGTSTHGDGRPTDEFEFTNPGNTGGKSDEFEAFSNPGGSDVFDTNAFGREGSADMNVFTEYRELATQPEPEPETTSSGGQRGQTRDHNNNNQHGDHAKNNLGHMGDRQEFDQQETRYEESHLQEETERTSDHEGQAAHSHDSVCRELQLPECVESVPWAATAPRNWLNHTTSAHLAKAMPLVKRALLSSECSPLAPLYACSVLQPPCDHGHVLPPCQAFCHEVARACGHLVPQGALPGLFNCRRFPASDDPSVCVSAMQEELDPHVGTTDSLPSTLHETTISHDLMHFTGQDVADFTLNTGIISLTSKDSMPTIIVTEIPSTEIIFVPTTIMSLADRLKNSLSKTTTLPDANNNHNERLSSFSRPNMDAHINPNEGMSLADRFSMAITQKTRMFNSESQMSRTTAGPQSDAERDPGSDGIMSLAELLALSNQANMPVKPVTRPPPKRKPFTSEFTLDMFTQSISTEPTIQRSPLSTRLRFRGTTTTNNPSLSSVTTEVISTTERRTPLRSVNDLLNRLRTTSPPALLTSSIKPAIIARRIPVRNVNELPKLKFPRRTRTHSSSTTPTPGPSPPVTESITCPELQCLDGKCISLSQLNDGVIDCLDGSDEHDFGGLIS